jgi:hypothetical protein
VHGFVNSKAKQYESILCKNNNQQNPSNISVRVSTTIRSTILKTHEENIHLGAGLGQIQNMAGLNLVFAKWNYTYWQLDFA